MAPRSRRSIRAREAVQHRWEDRETPISAGRMAYAIVVEGGRPEQKFRIFERCGFRIPPRDKIYREMTLVGNEICVMARESMRFQREQLPLEPSSALMGPGIIEGMEVIACLLSMSARNGESSSPSQFQSAHLQRLRNFVRHQRRWRQKA